MKMAFVGNLLWFVFGGGLLSCILWFLLGCVMFLSVVGIPFAFAAWRIAGFAAFPFGKELVDVRLLNEQRVLGTALGNFLWIVLAGLWLAISHVVAGVAECVTIIGIPFGLAHFKLAAVCFAPLGKKAVPVELAAAARMRHAQAQLS
jgi:uncharacterized membrane protein YccF (DUF307 family)